MNSRHQGNHNRPTKTRKTSKTSSQNDKNDGMNVEEASESTMKGTNSSVSFAIVFLEKLKHFFGYTAY